MKFVDEYRDQVMIRKVVRRIEGLVPRALEQARRPPPLKVMEVCGGHTHTIFRYGVEELLYRVANGAARSPAL